VRLDCYLSSHHAGRAVDIKQGTVFQCKACNHVMIAKHWGLHCGQSEWLTPDESAEMLGDEAHVVRDLPLPIWEQAKEVQP
jgi:hypothetical protein